MEFLLIWDVSTRLPTNKLPGPQKRGLKKKEDEDYLPTVPRKHRTRKSTKSKDQEVESSSSGPDKWPNCKNLNFRRGWNPWKNVSTSDDPFIDGNFTAAENFEEYREMMGSEPPERVERFHPFISEFSTSTEDRERERREWEEAQKQMDKDVEEMHDWNLIHSGPDHPGCRKVKVSMYEDKIFATCKLRPFTFHFPLQINFGSKPLKHGMILTSDDTIKRPTIRYKGKDKLYLLILTDLDWPIPLDPYQAEKVHWLVINIPGEVFWLGEEALPFEPPSNLHDKHRYLFVLYEQTRGRMRLPDFPRFRIHHDALVKDLSLKPVSATWFFHQGTVLGEKDYGREIGEGPLSSSDNDPDLSAMKKAAKKDLQKFAVWMNARERA